MRTPLLTGGPKTGRERESLGWPSPEFGGSDPDPVLGIEIESAEPPPWRARGGGLAARPVNDKAPVCFDGGLELRECTSKEDSVKARQSFG